jgi:hypothetical protein
MSQHKCVGFTLFGRFKILFDRLNILQRSEYLAADSGLHTGVRSP